MKNVRAMYLFLILFCAASIARGANPPPVNQIAVSKEEFLLKYTSLLLQEVIINDKEPSLYSNYTEKGCEFAEIKTKDGTVYYEIVLRQPGNAAQSFFAIFKEDFATKYVEPVARGLGGNPDQEIKDFQSYDGKTLDL